MNTNFLIIIVLGISASSSFFASDVYASIYFDKDVYTWTDKINIRVTEHGVDSEGTQVKIYTSNHELNYSLAKAGNGLFTGEIILTGFSHDVTGDGEPDTNPKTVGNGPNNGFLESDRDDDFTLSIKFADGGEIRKTAKINWNVATIDFDRLFNDSGERIYIKVHDVDMNLNPESRDKISIQVFSDSDKAGLVIDARELSDDPGTFVTIFSVSSQHDSKGNRLFALPSDMIYVQYDDHTLPKPYGIDDDLTVLVELPPFPLEQIDDKKIEWSQGNYKTKNGTSSAKIIVTDPEQNKFADSIDTVKARIFSDSSIEGITIELYETNKDSGIFERTFAFSDKRSAPNILYGRYGDTLTALYDPVQSFDSEGVFMAATAWLGSTGPPLERAPISHPRIMDSFGNFIDSPAVGQQIQITSDIANESDREQKFTYLVMIQDGTGITVSLAWIDGILNPESSFSPSASWIPQKEGHYVATMFVWESVDNPTALSPPIQIEFTVISEKEQKAKQYDDGDYMEMFMFVIPQGEFGQFTEFDLRTLHYYKINHQDVDSLPRLGMLVNMTADFPLEPLSELSLRINDDQITQYRQFFEQKCREQRPYATNDVCMNADFAFEHEEKWYYVYPKLAPHGNAIEDRKPSWDPEYFTRHEN
ncbi:hypothetical protein NZNM25_01900 [Nitrosopumilus zosterae]|uniref:Uncharacterized protein n=1 Tax=Nitrosopumilus zosterae TaxID=718286 RepID=A0A2S2KP38_9ARCH|nr:hypothetical protein [Nitrosopumilus zosterae]BDQ31187.1 hypothetical protein NZOSNM25_001298 [Nitrosopumilus zosterae]GBH33399.1 hypothetical protein NZNM25_01900 [Nitrosopumilus zosterae]